TPLPSLLSSPTRRSSELERDSQYDGEKRHKKDSSADSKHRADESGGKPHSADGKKQVRVRRYAPLPVMCNSMVPLVPWHEKGTEYRSANWRSPGQARPCGAPFPSLLNPATRPWPHAPAFPRGRQAS